MADSCNVPKEIIESMRDVLDKRVKVSIRRLVKMEIKADKLDNRVLALSPCRLFILTAKAPTKVESSFHFLDIQALESKKAGQLVLTIDNKDYKFISIDSTSDVMDHLIMHLGLSLKQIFPSFPLERLIVKVDIQPEDRMKMMRDMIKTMDTKDPGPCGGFTTMYQCMCDFHGLPYREEVAWDVDTIYLSHDSRELRLQDFDHLPHKDLIPVISALEHNTWFKSLNASNVKLSMEVCNEVIKVMRRNAILEEINLKSTGIKPDFVQKLSTALISNSGSQLQVIDLSNNVLEDKVITHLLGAVKTLSCGLSALDLSNTGISTRCINKMGEALSQNLSVMTSLTSLKLNDNGLKGEDFPMLYNCLAQPNSISTLDLSSTDCVLDSLCDPLLRGCPNLTHLKLSKTLFTHKRGKEVNIPQSWKQLFSSTCCLEFVDLSSCKLPVEALKELLLGVASNRNLKELHLDVSSNELGSAGVSILTSCFTNIKSIKSLDISNNGFDLELKNLLPELGKIPCLKHLAIGRNFNNIKPKYMTDLMTCLVTALLQEESALESLSLADSRLRMDTTYVINALGSNNTLIEIDLSGNGIGDHGARMLAKALQINTKLQKVVWDKNGVSAPGFEDVAEALKKNMSLKKMPFPVNDASASMRLYPDRTESALQKIESFLQRNHCPGRFAPDIAYRLQQGFLISSTQQILDRKVVQLQDSIQALNSLGSMEVYASDVTTAESLVNDANKSRQLLPGLQDIALESQSPGNVIDKQLQSTATQLREIIEEQLKKTVEDMLKCTTTNCPTIMDKEAFRGELNDGCQQKTSLQKDFTKNVLEGAATDIHNVMGEMNLAVASLISDTVIDEVIESLSSSHKTLSNHLSLKKSGAYKESSNEEDEKDGAKLSVEASPQLSTKRNSMWNRKTRPQSTMEREKRRPSIPEEERTEEIIYQNLRILSGHEAISMASTWQVQEKLKDLSQENTPVGSTEKLADFEDLPSLSTTSKPLTHVTKSRPRPPKCVRPTRPILDTGSTEMELSVVPENGLLSGTVALSLLPKVEVTEPAAPSSSSSTKGSRKISTSKEEGSHPSKADGKAGKQDEGSKPESKKWSPMSFIKGKSKEDKPEKEKKSHSFSSGITNIFKKKDEKKRPSVSETPPVLESGEPKKDAAATVSESKDLEKSLESVKENASAASESAHKEDRSIKKTTADTPEKSSAPSLKEKHPSPVRPPRERASNAEKSAILPPSKEKKEQAKAPALAEREDSTLEDEKNNKKDTEPSASSEDTKPTVEEVETDKKESPSETPAPSQPAAAPSGPKLPPGAVKMGGLTALGNRDLLDQLKLKQKRKSHNENSPDESPKDKPEKSSPSLSSETNNNDLSTSMTAATTTTTTTTSNSPAEQSSKKLEESKPTSIVKTDKDTPSPVSPPSSIPATSTSSKTATTNADKKDGDTNDKPSPSTPDATTTTTTTTTTSTTAPIPPAKMPAPAPRAIVPPKRPSSVVVPSASSSLSSSSSSAAATASSLSPSSSSTTESSSDQKEPTKPERPLSTGPTPAARPRPTPPLKPRPPIMPRPKKRDSDIDDNTDHGLPSEAPAEILPSSASPLSSESSTTTSAESPTPPASAVTVISDPKAVGNGGEVAYDSITLRLSVKDKIKRMSQAKAGLGSDAPPGGVAAMGILPPPVKKKVSSLPRDTPVPERVEEDASKEHSSKDQDSTDNCGQGEAVEQDWVVVEGNNEGEATTAKCMGDNSTTDKKEESKQGEEGAEKDEDNSVKSGGNDEIFI